MASGNEDFLFADDFDVIMAILEEDENVEEQFLEAVQEVSIKLAPKKCDCQLVVCLDRARWFIRVLLRDRSMSKTLYSSVLLLLSSQIDLF